MTTPEGDRLDASLSAKQHVAFVAAGNAKIHKTILDAMRVGRVA